MLGASRAARACTACARPISPPSTATAALFDMFCGLNGATFKPRRTSTRASPATSVDLPALEPVAWIISAGVAAISELDAFLALHALAERMFDQCHLGDQVGHLDQRGMGVAPGNDDML